MSEACSLRPSLKGGKISPLFTKLEEYLGSIKEARYWYDRVASEQFKVKFPHVNLDENSEPLFTELLTKCGFTKLVPEQDLIFNLNKKYKEIDATVPNNTNLQLEATEFNNGIYKNRVYAKVVQTNDKIKIVIEPIRKATNNIIQKIAINGALNLALEKLLAKWGIGISALNALEEDMGIGGITDVDCADKAANGLKQLIRIAKGKRGEASLPEEFAHFAIYAIQNSPLKDRLLSLLNNDTIIKQVLGDMYDQYALKYHNNPNLLAMEALAKLVAKELRKENPEVPKPALSLFSRFINKIFDFFGFKDSSEIDNILKEVHTSVNELTSNIVNDKYEMKINTKEHHAKLLNIDTKLKSGAALLNKIIAHELKRLKLYSNKNEKFDEKQHKLIAELAQNLLDNRDMEGIFTYIENSLGTLMMLESRMANINDSNEPLNTKLATLRSIRNFISSYGSIMSDIRKEMNEEKRNGNDTYYAKLSPILSKNESIIADIGNDYAHYASKYFIEFIRPFMGKGITINIGRKKYQKTYTAEELVNSMSHDITFFDRWLDSGADSSDMMIQIYDQILKQQAGVARLNSIKLEKLIEAKTRQLELDGYPTTEFMYEKDENGVPTGNFIMPYSDNLYQKAKTKMLEEMDKKYGTTTDIDLLEKKKTEILKWAEKYSKNKEIFFKNPAYLALDAKQLEYYKFIMTTKRTLDGYIGKKNNLAPQIRKDFIDRIKNNKNKGKAFADTFKDMFVKREDDIDMVDKRDSGSVNIDFEGNEVHRVPIYYTKPLSEMKDLSLDAASSMIAYAAMAYNFHEMDNVVDVLEVGKSILMDKKINQTDGDKIKEEKFTVLGVPISNSLFKNRGESNFFKKLETMLEMRMYGIGQKDEGKIGKAEVSKIVNFLNRLTSLGTTALSPLTGSANVIQNVTMDHIEAISGRFFSAKTLAKADAVYGKNILSSLSEFTSRIKHNKLDLFSELFNVKQDFKNKMTNIDFNKKTWLSRILGEKAMWYTTSSGDHWTQHRVAIALALEYKLKEGNKDITLWDALEKVPVDKSNPELGYTLEIKQGITKADGTLFSTNDIIKFSNRVRATENMLYGIYNSEDVNALQQIAIGRLVLHLRKWMRPLYMNRMRRAQYNFDLEQVTEGYFMTSLRFLKMLAGDLQKSEFHIIKDFKNLTDYEKNNILKTLHEIGIFISLLSVLAIMGAGDGDDDEERSQFTKLIRYSLLRLRTDMGALIPGPRMLDEGLKLFTSPFAALSYIMKLRKLLYLVDPTSYTEEVESGKYKGYTKAEAVSLDILPFRNQIINFMDPDVPARWYK